MPAGHPITKPYDPEIASLVCERLATSEDGIEQVLDELRLLYEDRTPSLTTWYRWREANEQLRELSARAKDDQADLLHGRAQVYARQALIGTTRKEVRDGEKVEITETTSDNVERSKLLVQTTLKRAGQLSPKKYGDRTTLAGDPEAPLILADRIANARKRAK